MKQIPLSRGLFALVDDADFAALSAFNWHASPNKSGGFYAARGEGTSTVYMHREILGLKKGEIADHTDHDGLNNQRANLRRCDYTLNLGNTRRANKTGYRGVYRNTKSASFYYQVQFRGSRIMKGGYATPEEAARAYDVAARRLFGEFATLNFPPANDDARAGEAAA